MSGYGRWGRPSRPGPGAHTRPSGEAGDFVSPVESGRAQPSSRVPPGLDCPDDPFNIPSCPPGILRPPPQFKNDREAMEALEDWGYNGAVLNSGWPWPCFLFPEQTRPPYSQSFRQQARIVTAGAAFQDVVLFNCPEGKNARMLEFACNEVNAVGNDLIWRFLIRRTGGGQGTAFRQNDLLSTILGGTGGAFERLLVNLGRNWQIVLQVQAPAAGRTVQGILKGWAADVHGAGPVSSGYELP